MQADSNSQFMLPFFTSPPSNKFSLWKGLLIYSMVCLYIIISNNDDDDDEQSKRNTSKVQYSCSSTCQFWQAAYSDV